MALQSFTLDPAATDLENAPKDIRNETGGALAAGDLLYITGWNEAENAFLVAKADADVAGGAARLVMRGALADATTGQAFRTYRLTGVDTSAGAVGDPVYLDTVAGGWTLTAPAGASALQQVVGRVAVVNASTGEVEFDLIEAAAVEAFGSNEIKTDAITASEIAAGAVGNSELASTAAKDNLDALADTARGYVKTDPASGEYPVINVQRDSSGKLDVDYDDVAIP